MTCAGPRWTESSWSFASTRLTFSAMPFSAASGPRFIASVKASLISYIVSWRYWIPFVASSSMFVSWIHTTFFASFRSIPSSSSFFARTFESLMRWPDAISGADRGDDLRLERLDLHVEAVVLVRRLAFEWPALPADALPVHDNRSARLDRALVVVLDAVDRDLEVEFAHAGDQVLAGLLVDLHLDARVRLRKEAQGLDELRQVRRRLRLNGDRDDRVGVVDDFLEGLHLLVVAHGRSGDGVPQPDHGDDIPRVDLVDRDAFRADDHRDGLRALGLRHPADPQLLAPANLARIEATGRHFARLGIDDDFRHHEPHRTVFIDRHHRFADGRLRVSFPDDRDPDFLCFERIRQVADHHVQHDAVERRLLRELFHRPLLTVLVDVLEPDARALREGGAHGPLVVRAPERDAARLDVHH